MYEDQSETGAPVQQQAPQISQPHKNRLWRMVLGFVLIVGIIWGAGALLSNKKSTDSNGNAPNTSVQKLFEDMLSTAAGKSQVRLTHVQQEFASKADFESKKIQSSTFSTAEFDLAKQDYRAVYANQQGSSTLSYFVVGRCLQNNMFSPSRLAINTRTVEDAKSVLAEPFSEAVSATSSEGKDCNLANPDRPGRITDGVIPLGLTKIQAENWIKTLKESDFVTIEDKGATTYNQKTVRKLRVVTSSLAGAASFFRSVESGAGLQLTTETGAPGPESYRLDKMPTSDNVDGYYLIDEQNKLPVYSEFTTVLLLSGDGGKPGKVFKQTYNYPNALTLDQTSTISTFE